MKRVFLAAALLLSPAMLLAAAQTPPAPAPAAPPSSTGTWKVDGDVQGTAVKMTCVLNEADKKLTGTCAGAGEDMTPRKLTGEVNDRGLAWQFESEYQGSAITVSMAATLNEDGTKMSGTMSVAPMGADGTFVAVKQ